MARVSNSDSKGFMARWPEIRAVLGWCARSWVRPAGDSLDWEQQIGRETPSGTGQAHSPGAPQSGGNSRVEQESEHQTNGSRHVSPVVEHSMSSRMHLDGMHDSGQADIAVLERELQARVKGEVRFDNGSRGLYSTDASNYRQVPIGVVIPSERRGCGTDRGALPQARRADAVSRRRHQPGRAVLQRRRGDRLLQVHEPHARRSTPSRKLARVAAGRGARRPARRGRAHHSPSAPIPPRTTAARWAA